MFSNPEEVFGGSAPLLRLIDLIYSSVQDPSMWAEVMEGIAEAVHGQSTAVFARFPEDHLLAMTRTDPVAWDAYAGYYSSINVLMDRCDEVFADGKVRYAHLALPDAELLHTEFYNDFFLPNDMHHSLGLKIPLGDLPSAYLSCQRSKSRGPFGEREGLVYETLQPHLQRALQLHMQFSQLQSKALGLGMALDALEHAVFGLDGEGRVLVANKRAEALAQAADGIRVLEGRLTAIYPEQDRELQVLLSGVVAAGTYAGISAGGSMLLERKAGGGAIRLSCMPYPAKVANSVRQLAALVFVSDPSSLPRSRGSILRALYGLTPTESRVADLLMQGLTIREVADRLGATLETGRFHTKRVLAKTGTKRQTELMRLMLSLPRG